MNQSIRRICLTATAACGLLLAPASAQTTATTDPVGAVSISIPAGNTPVGIPLVKSPVFEGTTSAVSEGGGTTTFSFSGVPFEGSSFSSGIYPSHMVQIISDGTAKGLVLDIQSNTNSSVVVAGDMKSAFNLGDSVDVSIRPFLTLNDVFSSAEGLTAFVDTVKLFNDDGSTSSFIWDGQTFRDSSFGDVGTFPIHPGRGLIFFGNSQVDLTVVGAVPLNETLAPIYAGVAVNFVSFLNPSGTVAGGEPLTLGSSGIGENLTAFAGAVKFFSTDGDLVSNSSDTYLWDGSVFRDGQFGDASDVIIPIDSAVVISNPTEVNITLPSSL